MFNWLRRFSPAWRREKLYRAKLEYLRFLCQGAFVHHPWYKQNPWARDLTHGNLYRSKTTGDTRIFRTVLHFDSNDFEKWERIQQKIREGRALDRNRIGRACAMGMDDRRGGDNR